MRVTVLVTVVMLTAVAVADTEGKPLISADLNVPFFQKPFLFGAHRSGASILPENTVHGFQEAARRWPGILLETDARTTADGHIVLMHDDTVDRTTDGAGRVDVLTLAQIRALDAGYRFTMDDGKTFPFRGKGLKVPTLQKALEAIPDSNILVEFKASPGIAQAAIAAIRAAGAQDRVLVASFDPAVMDEVRQTAPRMARCYSMTTAMELLGRVRGGTLDGYVPVDHVLSITREHLFKYRLTPEELQAIRGAGVRVQVHTIDAPEEMQKMLRMGVDSILTDRPDLLAEAIAQWQQEVGEQARAATGGSAG